ncbi:MAG: hypothetical protein M0Z49_13210 [Chloroflexi bacterium]|nr:hypothetical protein [Chloroflexota bacterium]
MSTNLGWVLALAVLVLAAALGAVLAGFRRFARLARTDVESLLRTSAPPPQGLITEEMLGGLPEPVRRYLTYAGVVGRPFVGTVRLTQAGRMQPNPGQPWFPLSAEEHYSVRPPGFVWDAVLRLGPFPLVRARDMYREGAGNMLIKALGLFPIADVVGPEMDQGSMMRYLSEMIWFPTAFLGDNVSFEPVDDRSARVTLTDSGRTVSATMIFDEIGKLVDFAAERYRTVDRGFVLERWSTPVDEYGELAGLRLPVRGRAVWKLADGDLEYIDVTVAELQYDVGL